MTVSGPAARCCVPHSTSSLYLQGRPSSKDEKTFPIRLTHQTTEQLHSTLDCSSQPLETNLEHSHPSFKVNSRHIHIHLIPSPSILSLTLLALIYSRCSSSRITGSTWTTPSASAVSPCPALPPPQASPPPHQPTTHSPLHLDDQHLMNLATWILMALTTLSPTAGQR